MFCSLGVFVQYYYEKLAQKVADYVTRTKRFDWIIISFHINVYACFEYRIKDSVVTLRKQGVLVRSLRKTVVFLCACLVRVSFGISLVLVRSLRKLLSFCVLVFSCIVRHLSGVSPFFSFFQNVRGSKTNYCKLPDTQH